MTRLHRILFATLLAALIATIVGLIATNRPIVAHRSGPSYRNEPFYRLIAVTQEQFDTARQIASSAVAREEQWLAHEVLRIADKEVDLAFATALHEAAEHPSPLSPEAAAIVERLKTAQAQLDADRAEVARLTKLLSQAREGAKDALQGRLQLVEAQADLDQDEVDDAHQDLIRAGGDPEGIIERMKRRYEAREQAAGGLQAFVPSSTQDTVEDSRSWSVIGLARAWYSLRGKVGRLQVAGHDAQTRAAEFRNSHDTLDREADEQKTQEPAPLSKRPDSTAASVTSLRKRAADRKTLQVFDKRVEDETQLADTYARWSTLIQERQRQCEHRLLYCLLAILVIALSATVIDGAVSRSFAQRPPDRRSVSTLQSVAGYAVRGAGAILILLVVFGPPTQFAAVLALAGAGLTVALKDFIVAFLGWLVLMGRNGIRVGDWVEIDGVSGEVLEIGPLRTILLETGNWSDAGHPTGRKVVYMNGFAVEGNYFNFSTSGQWMWDEIQFSVPADSDPFAMAETVKQLVGAETQKNAQLASDEWRAVKPNPTPEAFHGEPVTSVRPTDSGATLSVRYITRANERHDVRSRIYRSMIDLQRQTGKR